MTIIEAIKEVLASSPLGLTSGEIYHQIISRNLYSFPAKNPKSVVNHTIRARCQGLNLPSSYEVKCFKILSYKDGKPCYGLIDPSDFPALAEQMKGADLSESNKPNGKRDFLTDLGEEKNLLNDFDIDSLDSKAIDLTPYCTYRAVIEKYSKDDFLNEVYLKESQYTRLVATLKKKKNIILQGAPGVGKTFAARRLAWSMMGEKNDSSIPVIHK